MTKRAWQITVVNLLSTDIKKIKKRYSNFEPDIEQFSIPKSLLIKPLLYCSIPQYFGITFYGGIY